MAGRKVSELGLASAVIGREPERINEEPAPEHAIGMEGIA